MLQTRLRPKLSGVPETMLWSLFDRAYEAKRPNGLIYDPDCVAIYDSIDFDFLGHFGQPTGLGAARAAEIDRVLRRWLSRHPSGCVVSLGEGLETQSRRVDNGKMTWLSVDLLDSIRVRETYLKPTGRFRHLALSALDPGWMDHVDARSGVFIVAQGLLMYFQPTEVRDIIGVIAERFDRAEMIFDLVPRLAGAATERGFNVTPNWTCPAMPWALDRNEAAPVLRSWCPGLRSIKCWRYRVPTRRPAIVEDVLDIVLPRRQKRPSLVHVRF